MEAGTRNQRNRSPRSLVVGVVTRPLYGSFPRRSTGLRRKEHARQAERLLVEMAERGLSDASWYEVIGALQHGADHLWRAAAGEGSDPLPGHENGFVGATDRVRPGQDGYRFSMGLKGSRRRDRRPDSSKRLSHYWGGRFFMAEREAWKLFGSSFIKKVIKRIQKSVC